MTDLEIRPSERNRWANCSGFPAFKALLASEGRLPPDETSEYAARGTVGHALVELPLNLLAVEGAAHAQDPSLLMRHVLCRVGGTVEQDGHQIEIDQELADAAVECVLSVCKLINDIGLCTAVFVEEPVASGTPDVVLWFAEVKMLVIVDHKFGAGLAVEAKGNKQLQQYAVEARDALGEDVEEVRLVINQPFNGGVKMSRHDASELVLWGEELRKEQWRVQSTSRRLAAGSWCRWCPCGLQCPAQEKAVEEAVTYDYVALGKAPALTAERLGERLRQYEDVLVPYGAALRARLHKGLEHGEYSSDEAGWKVVAKRASRQWMNESAAAELLSRRGFNQDEIYKMTMLSPAQIEKVAKVGGHVLPDLSDQVKSVSSGTTIARVVDKRPAKRKLVALGEFPSIAV